LDFSDMKKLIIASLFVLASGISAQAAQKCYEDVYVPEKLSCAGTDSNNADFAEGCKVEAAHTDQKEVECSARWVNINGKMPTQSQAEVCAERGLQPSTINGQRCAAGERRPVTGENYDNINYKFGKWGSTLNGGSTVKLYTYSFGGSSAHESGIYVPPTTASYYTCYDGDDKKDMDNTDYVVAYACE
jgi:hypothetical protein